MKVKNKAFFLCTHVRDIMHVIALPAAVLGGVLGAGGWMVLEGRAGPSPNECSGPSWHCLARPCYQLLRRMLQRLRQTVQGCSTNTSSRGWGRPLQNTYIYLRIAAGAGGGLCRGYSICLYGWQQGLREAFAHKWEGGIRHTACNGKGFFPLRAIPPPQGLGAGGAFSTIILCS